MASSPLKFNIDVAGIASHFKDFALEVSQDIQKAVGNLAAQTHSKVVEWASEELQGSRKEFLDSVGFEEISPGVWVVSVNEDGLWVEEGIEPNKDMKPDLLKNDAKTSKAGNKYKVIPFDYGTAPARQGPTKERLAIEYLKQNLRKEKIPYKAIERNSDGSPKVGKLHELNFGNVGGRLRAPGKGNTAQFKGVSIYQTMTKSGNVRRDILTFRTVSSGPASSGKWIHPGYRGKKFLDRAVEWAMQEWETKILPETLKKWD